MRKILLLLFMLICSYAWAASNYIEGDVLVVMRAPNGMNEISMRYLESQECRDYIASALDPIDAKLIKLYDALSWADGKIHFLARSETQPTQRIIDFLSENPNVISVSPNRVNRIKRNTMRVK